MADSMSPDLGTREGVLTGSQAERKLEPPRLWRVLLHNDDYTTQDFVVWVLETVFHKPRPEAFAVMLSVHQSGLGVAGVYTHDVAETKLKTTKNLAEQHEFPLLVTMEPELDPRNESH
jgi:ATP-dependent Clp protease adaptor protein ClpS